MLIPLGILAASGAGGGGAFESIASASGTGSANEITFSTIPGTFQSLQIRGIYKDTDTGSDGATLWIRFNSDTGTNYANHRLDGNGTAASAGGTASTTVISASTMPGNFGTSTMASVIIDIHDYASTTRNKTVRTFGGWDKNGSGLVRLSSGLWMNTSAITSITLRNTGVNFTSDTRFALYGIKGA